MLNEGSAFGINGNFGSAEIKISKANTKFCFSLHHIADNSNFKSLKNWSQSLRNTAAYEANSGMEF